MRFHALIVSSHSCRPCRSLAREIEAQPQIQEAEDDDEDDVDDPSTANLAERPDIVAKLEARYAASSFLAHEAWLGWSSIGCVEADGGSRHR